MELHVIKYFIDNNLIVLKMNEPGGVHMLSIGINRLDILILMFKMHIDDITDDDVQEKLFAMAISEGLLHIVKYLRTHLIVDISDNNNYCTVSLFYGHWHIYKYLKKFGLLHNEESCRSRTNTATFCSESSIGYLYNGVDRETVVNSLLLRQQFRC